MYGPTDQDVRTFLRVLVAFIVVVFACGFAIGRCSARYTVKVEAKPQATGGAQ